MEGQDVHEVQTDEVLEFAQAAHMVIMGMGEEEVVDDVDALAVELMANVGRSVDDGRSMATQGHARAAPALGGVPAEPPRRPGNGRRMPERRIPSSFPGR